MGLELQALFPLSQGATEAIDKAIGLAQPLFRLRGGAILENMDLETFEVHVHELRVRLFGRARLVNAFARSGFAKFHHLLADLPFLRAAHRGVSQHRTQPSAFPKLRFGTRASRPEPAILRRLQSEFLEKAHGLQDTPAPDPIAGVVSVLQKLTDAIEFEPRWLFEALKHSPESAAADLVAGGQTPASTALAIAMDMQGHRGMMPTTTTWKDPEHFVRACIGLIGSIRNHRFRTGRTRFRSQDDMDDLTQAS